MESCYVNIPQRWGIFMRLFSRFCPNIRERCTVLKALSEQGNELISVLSLIHRSKRTLSDKISSERRRNFPSGVTFDLIKIKLFVAVA